MKMTILVMNGFRYSKLFKIICDKYGNLFWTLDNGVALFLESI